MPRHLHSKKSWPCMLVLGDGLFSSLGSEIEMDMENPHLYINYYARIGYGHHIMSICSRALQTHEADPILRFWHAYGAMISRSYQVALENLEVLDGNIELEYAVFVLKYQVQQRYKGMNTNACTALAEAITGMEPRASTKALLLAISVYWHLGGRNNLQKAKSLLLRIPRGGKHDLWVQNVEIWVSLASIEHGINNDTMSQDDGDLVKLTLEKFDQVIAKGNKVEGILGKAHAYELIQDYTRALDELSQVIILEPSFIPAICEKGKLAMLINDWELVQEIVDQIYEKDPKDIGGLCLKGHAMLCLGSSTCFVTDFIVKIFKAIEQREPNNASIYFKAAQLFGRMAGRTLPVVLEKTTAMLRKAHDLCPGECSYVLELANQLYLLGDFAEAMSSYRLASEIDPFNIDAKFGMTQCAIVLRKFEDAEIWMHDCSEAYEVPKQQSTMLYLRAQLAWIKNKSCGCCVDLLDKAVDSHLKILRKKHDYEFFIELNPDRLLELVQFYSVLSRYTDAAANMNQTSLLLRSESILKHVLAVIPGLVIAHLFLARIHLTLGNFDAMHRDIQTVLKLDPTCASIHLLLAEVQLKAKDFGMVKQHLEQALSYDFVVRESLRYHILQAEILFEAQDIKQALQISEVAMSIPGSRQISPRLQMLYYTIGCPPYMEVRDNERACLYILRARCHTSLSQFREAHDVLEEGMIEFAGTPDEDLLLIAISDISIARGQVDSALRILQKVSSNSCYFAEAQCSMENIYSKVRHDKQLPESCTLEFVRRFSHGKNHIVLGDTLMDAHEVNKALETYEAGWKDNPRNVEIARKFGNALVANHKYFQAVEHYELALHNFKNSDAMTYLQYDLANLHFKLKNYKRAAPILRSILAKMENQNQSFNNHFEDYNLALDCLLLLFKVQNVQEKRSSGVEVRTKLKGFLLKVKQNEEVKNLADICFQFAQECEHSKDIDSAIMFLNDALNWNPVHVPAMVALARIRLSRGEVIECEQKCAFILKANPLNNVANDIINSLMLNKDLYESAFQHLNQVLQKEANCYSSLSQLVTLLEKFGRHEEIVHYLEAAERSLSNSYMPAGLFYCKGLHAWYSKDLHQALRMFNNARADKEWGQKAIHNMVEIYLSINNDMINDETHIENDTKVGEEEMHTALELLVESRMIDETSVRQVALECYALMVLKRKEDVEVALSRLQNITGSEKDHIVIRLAIATALVILKQSSKAKGELRVIERMTYRWEYGEDFERAWLMLANIHIQGGKTSAAEQLCKSCLKYNKSCSKAWEYLGLLMEKAQSYSEAISFYEKAWKYHRGTSLSIGYKLALCYLKAKQHIEAITVCQKVLKVFPEYGKIRKDILDKARQCLRP